MALLSNELYQVSSQAIDDYIVELSENLSPIVAVEQIKSVWCISAFLAEKLAENHIIETFVST
ncbi:MAG: primosomal protein N'' [Phenylobacterium sp.]|jgi:primosomal protein N''